ncbi:MAG: type II secretion system protein [Patescibacteria group bacterium]
MDSIKRAGFTLIEMMVVVSIFLVLTSVVLANYPKLNSQLTLGLVANDVALSVRQAQQYALGAVQRVGAPSVSVSYGIHFSTATPQEAQGYVLFADTAPVNVAPVPPGDFLYTLPPTNPNDTPPAGTGTLPSSVRILRLCAATQAQIAALPGCIASGTGPLVTSLDVVFRRPEPDMNVNGIASTSGTPFVEAVVVLANVDGSLKREVHVTLPGQIYVK